VSDVDLRHIGDEDITPHATVEDDSPEDLAGDFIEPDDEPEEVLPDADGV
jgi:hypothetical protein